MMRYVDQELTVEDMLADPIVQTLMRYDGVSASDVRHTIDQASLNRDGDAPEAMASVSPKSQKVPVAKSQTGAPRPVRSGIRNTAA
ncbi:hypothetical protein [Thalassospira australica]|uniref:hypothetical protein n=1 Tax=Thalassospira australica TaxID=1528106 RepID=UPI000AB6C3F9|nr:hypothetical protein [Thalassospira australica]